MQINPKTIIERRILIPSKGTQIAQNGIDCTIAETTTIPSKGFVNVAIAERFNIPQDMIAYPFPRSSYSRRGCFISSGLFDSGYKNIDAAPAGVSIYNMSNEDITIEKDTRILQFIFIRGECASMYDGYYNHTSSIESKLK